MVEDTRMNDDINAIELAIDLTVAWLGNPHTRTTAEEVPAFLTSMHQAVTSLSAPTQTETKPVEREHTPAISVRKSLASPEHIISMIDGKKYKALRRHLSANGLTPEQYRERYGLKADYPIVAPAYAAARSAMAKSLGLGRKAGQKVEEAAAPVAKAARRGGKAALAAAREALGTSE